jgi:hypothetical protein
MKLSKIKETLKAKGYDLSGKSEEFIRSLYALYLPRKRGTESSEWKSWSGTNRPHHCR